MEININTSIGEIVKANFKTAQIFDKNGIDFCCGGKMSLGDACKKSNTDFNQLVPQLAALVLQNDPDSKYIDSLGLTELSDYIEKRHHTYVNENVPFLLQKLDKLCRVHGANHPELLEIKALFEGAAENLSTHMKKEELILFPHIRKMEKYKKEGKGLKPEEQQAASTIESMQEEHEVEGERFVKIAKLTGDYTCPPDGCGTYRVTFETLKDFETDLHRHIHLESNILFKKAIVLEKELLNK